MNAVGFQTNNPELEAAAQLAMFNIFRQTEQTNPFPAANFGGRFESMMEGFKENALKFFGNSADPWHQAIANDFAYREMTRQQMQESIAQQAALAIVRDQELTVETHRFYDTIYNTVLEVKNRFNVNSKTIQDYASTVLKDEVDKAVKAFLKESLQVVKDNAQLFATAGYFLAKDLLSEVSKDQVDEVKLQEIKQQTIAEMLKLKKDEVTKLFQECIATPTPGCHEEVKNRMDELKLLEKINEPNSP